MGDGFTRRRFLAAIGAGVTYAALAGCGSRERISKARTPKGGSVKTPRVWPTPDAPSGPSGRAWDFRSRPDLRPPAVAVTTRARGVAPGYVFVSPKLGRGQHGPLIVDDMGRPVWFRNGLYALNFRVQTYEGEPVLTWWEGQPTPRPSVGEYVVLDGSYREVKRVQAGNGYKGNQHDFLITPQGTALLTIYNLVSRDLSYLGGPVEGRVIEGIAQELDIETGEVLFEWHSLDHVGVEESYYEKYDSDQLDYFHINSIEVDHDDNLLISARNTSAVYKLDRRSGKVLWRLSGKKSDFEMGEGTRTYWQHDARRQEDGTITIFDNGAGPQVHPQSRGVVVELDEEAMKATLRRAYTHPDKLVSTSQGNMQVLPNGNVFVGWGSQPFVSEFSHDGELLFDASIPPDDDSYRAFRFPWKGQPDRAPDVAADRRSDDEVTLYASWNGATEIESWEVLSGPHPDGLEPLGSVPRDGFETAISARTEEPYVAVRARNSSGRVLGTSSPVKRESRSG
jgi:outer membrane protein assembly factor BamB